MSTSLGLSLIVFFSVEDAVLSVGVRLGNERSIFFASMIILRCGVFLEVSFYEIQFSINGHVQATMSMYV